jgi:small subunit ribosomal protein S3
MGQKIHPVGFRLGVIRGHDSHWFFHKRQYRFALESDYRIREVIKNRVGKGLVSRVEIERAATKVKVTVFTSRPGAIIGKQGKGIDALTADLNRMVRKEDKEAQVQVNVSEVRQPEMDAQLVAENIAVQLEKRISHRRAIRQSMTRATRMNCRGMKIKVSGRLNGSEIARSEGDMMGKVPLHTLRADIDYGYAIAETIYGTVGCKVWVYKGEVLPEKQLAALNAAQDEMDNRRRRERDERRGRGPRDRGDRGGDRGPRTGGSWDRGAPRSPEGGAPRQEVK